MRVSESPWKFIATFIEKRMSNLWLGKNIGVNLFSVDHIFYSLSFNCFMIYRSMLFEKC